MEKYEIAVKTFVDKMGYLNNPHVLGIVIYGSYTTGYNNKKSDIDLHIIMDNSFKEIIRAVTVVDGFKIEYFEKSINELYVGAYLEFYTQSNALVPIIGRGTILFDSDCAVQNLQDYILTLYNNPLPPISKDESIEQLAIAYTMLQRLEQSLEADSIDFNSNYYLLNEKIRKVYSKMLGCPEIPPAKAVRIYQDEKYREAFGKTKIPDKEYIEKYFNILAFEGTKQQKMILIQDIFRHATFGLEFDPDNYRIRIKSRYSALNGAHKE